MRPRHYTAENIVEPCQWHASPSGFNEAAALHRGKLGWLDAMVKAGQVASMRPRHYTAENQAAQAATLGPYTQASMRPRHYTAENSGGWMRW